MAITYRVVILVALGIIPGLLVPQTSTVLLWLAAVVTLCLIDLLLAPSPRVLQVERQVEALLRLSVQATSTLTVINPGTHTVRGEIRDAWPPSAGAQKDIHKFTIARGKRTRVNTVLIPTRRGDRLADLVTIRSFGPLGLLSRQISLKVPGRIRVLPKFSSQKYLPSRLAKLRELDGRTMVVTRGQGTEFDSLRNYVKGDEIRDIDWRATARARDVMVRTWHPERDRHVVIVSDLSRSSAMRLGTTPRLDSQIETTLLLAALASKAGDHVHFLAVDTRVQAQVLDKKGSELIAALANAMAPLEASLKEISWPLVAATIAKTVQQRSLVVLLTGVDSTTLHSELRQTVQLLSRKHFVMVASATDPDLEIQRKARTTAKDIYLAAAAERTEIEKTGAATNLNEAGAEVVEATTEQLPPAVADTYIRLKSHGKL